jgi:hypothetical protein
MKNTVWKVLYTVSSFHANWMKNMAPEAILDSDGPIFKNLLL